MAALKQGLCNQKHARCSRQTGHFCLVSESQAMGKITGFLTILLFSYCCNIKGDAEDDRAGTLMKNTSALSRLSLFIHWLDSSLYQFYFPLYLHAYTPYQSRLTRLYITDVQHRVLPVLEPFSQPAPTSGQGLGSQISHMTNKISLVFAVVAIDFGDHGLLSALTLLHFCGEYKKSTLLKSEQWNHNEYSYPLNYFILYITHSHYFQYIRQKLRENSATKIVIYSNFKSGK